MPRPKLITHAGHTRTRQEWADLLGLPVQTIAWRHRQGMSPEMILSKEDLRPFGTGRALNSRRSRVQRAPAIPRTRFAERTFLLHDTEQKNIAQWAIKLGLSEQTIVDRLNKGLPISQVLAPRQVRQKKKRLSKRPRPETIFARTKLTFEGETMNLIEWGSDLGIDPRLILRRLDAGKSATEALSKCHLPRGRSMPVRPSGKPAMRVPSLAEVSIIRKAA